MVTIQMLDNRDWSNPTHQMKLEACRNSLDIAFTSVQTLQADLLVAPEEHIAFLEMHLEMWQYELNQCEIELSSLLEEEREN
jgi:hypothetical protein